MSYKPKHFIVQELVDPAIYEAKGDAALAMLDPALLESADKLRDRFGPCTINNWHSGGQYKESGLRRPDTKTGAAKSAHKIGKALDLKFAKATPREVYDHILKNPSLYPGITELEDVACTPTWLHIGCRAHGGKGIRVIRP